ncbi:uncharacterized protein [Leptinotarsa decemlineata]|uniref:uncharacterized protein n=1 Tax=Leptinotarsa decemlineata TaxID=7539 RepID=UPI003D3081C5
MKVLKEDTQLLYFRSSWYGARESLVLVVPKKWKKYWRTNRIENEFELPSVAQEELLPKSSEKYSNLQSLKKFCQNAAADEYYSSLPHVDKKGKSRLPPNKPKKQDSGGNQSLLRKTKTNRS